MTHVIVPVDFSETSLNAARYAAHMYEFRADVKVMLYHVVSNEQEKANATSMLNNLRNNLSAKVNFIEAVVDSGSDFIDSLSEYAKSVKAYLIIMGLTGKTPLEQRFSGTNTLKMTERNVCPILIIPPSVNYQKIQNVLIASEMKDVDETPTIRMVKRVLDDFKPNVHILNVDSSHYISITPEFKAERDKMAELLKDYNPEFYFMRLFDFQEAMDMFIKDKNINMVIIAPKAKNFFNRIFKEQHTKTMIYRSSVAVLTIQE